MAEKKLKSKEYYLAVGRFVPENNYETMIREFMASKTTKDFALITNISDKFLDELKEKTGYTERYINKIFLDEMGFSPEAILLILDYCISMDKRNMKYIYHIWL